MYALFINWNDIAAPLGVVVSFFAIATWFLSRFLDDKKDKTTFELEIERLKEIVHEIRTHCKNLGDDGNHLKEKLHNIDLRLSSLISKLEK